MSAILRLAPGGDAPWAGTYRLVGHYGEPIGFSVKCDKGQRLPLVAATAEEPQWFVMVHEVTEDAQAA
jgi:hypothetical protein